MAKSFKTVYFKSEILLEAERQNLDLNSICEEALFLAINKDKNQGTSEGAAANLIEYNAQKSKDQEIVRHYSNGLTKRSKDKYSRALSMYQEKYNLSQAEALKELGL